MIKFFRHIRQKLLVESRFNKYLLYAVGEIILVVIGILLALQINNWNENRNDLRDESEILINLNQEFQLNNKLLQQQKNITENARQSGLLLMSYFGKNKDYLIKQNVDSLLYVVLESGSFRPSENTFDDLIQSGRFKLLKNEKLKNLLNQWKVSLQSLKTTFSRIELKIDNDLVPYLTQNYSLKDLDQYGQLNWETKSVLLIDKLAIFQDIVFENILDDYLYRIVSTQNLFIEVEKIILQIIEETKLVKN